MKISQNSVLIFADGLLNSFNNLVKGVARNVRATLSRQDNLFFWSKRFGSAKQISRPFAAKMCRERSFRGESSKEFSNHESFSIS